VDLVQQSEYTLAKNKLNLGANKGELVEADGKMKSGTAS